MAENHALMTFVANVPTGAILPFAGDTTDQETLTLLKEEGWLPCDGAALSKAEYRPLFDVLGYQFGGAEESFHVPDARGLFTRGAQSRDSRGPSGPPGTVQTSATALPTIPFVVNELGEHDHTMINLPTSDHHTYYTAGHYTAAWNDSAPQTDSGGYHSHTVNGGGDKETRALNVYLDYVIKYKE